MRSEVDGAVDDLFANRRADLNDGEKPRFLDVALEDDVVGPLLRKVLHRASEAVGARYLLGDSMDRCPAGIIGMIDVDAFVEADSGKDDADDDAKRAEASERPRPEGG